MCRVAIGGLDSNTVKPILKQFPGIMCIRILDTAPGTNNTKMLPDKKKETLVSGQCSENETTKNIRGEPPSSHHYI